jgi:hypothetical protein
MGMSTQKWDPAVLPIGEMEDQLSLCEAGGNKLSGITPHAALTIRGRSLIISVGFA